MYEPRSRRTRWRRGIAAVAMIIVLLILQLVVVGMVLGSGADQDLSYQRLSTVRAFYAAEGGMNMATRELFVGIDEDGDTDIGTVATTTVGDAQVTVTKVFSGTDWTLTSEGTAGACRRQIEALLD